MSDKFVVSTNEIGEIIVTDVETGKVYRYDNLYKFFGLIRLMNEQQARIRELEKEKMELEKKLECCEYEHFTNELDKIHEKIDKGDYSDFKTLKQEEKDKQIEEDYARLQRRKILERSGNCEPLTLKYNSNTTYMG